MRETPPSSTGDRFPPGFQAVPVQVADENTPLRLCVLVRTTPDPAAGYFFQLRDLLDAQVYLGCVTDTGGNVREWIEIWVQSPEGLKAGLPVHRGEFTNAILDRRWAAQCQVMRALAPDSLIETRWEKHHPRPSLIDIATSSLIQPEGADGSGHWELCQDDLLLAEAGLPPYSTSLARYLYLPSAGKASRFVPVAGAALENASTVSPTQALGLNERLVPFNLQGGLMLVATFYPFGYEEYADVLGGKPWSGLIQGKTQFQFGDLYRRLADSNQQQHSGATLFLGAHGRTGRLVETLHLKLRLLGDALSAVKASVQAHPLPFLNLSPESFRVRLVELSEGLPFLWTAKCLLVKPPQTFEVKLETTEKPLFVRTGQSAVSIYLPGGQIAMNRGLGNVRVRKILPHEQNSLIIEGTLVMQEPARCSPRDVLWMRLPMSTGFVDLYGHIDRDSLAFAEVRFRTMPQHFPETIATALRSGAIVVFPGCQYDIVPLLSSPCDLYSLGVLAIRTLLVNDSGGLLVALDELLSLARQVALEHKPDVPLPARIGSIFRQKADWLLSLGPHRLLAESLSPDDAITIVPADLWYEVLAAMVRLFPGAGPDSYCADLGDAPPLALESVFDRPLADLENLLVKTRSLIAIDWTFNQEIRAVIDEFRHR